MVDDAPCGLLTTDAKGLILQVNATFCTWVGYSAEELVRLRRLQELLSMGGRIFHQTHWYPLLVMQGSLSEVKLEVLHRDRTPIPMVVSARRQWRSGAWVHYVAAFVARDRDRYERELLSSRQKLETMVAEATRLKRESQDRALFAEQMIGIVSHDLRTPLTAVTMGVKLLERLGATPQQRDALSRIARAADRASQLTKDLLDFTSARIGTGLAVTLLPLDLHVTTELAVGELSVAFPARHIAHVAVGRGVACVDDHRLAQAVGNLVANAVAYGDKDKQVTVTSSIDAAGWKVSVHNWGRPIPPEVQTSLFQPMVRGVAEGSANRSVGLGLYIVSEIAKAHRGTLAVWSTQEAGTTFEFGAPHPAA